MRAHAAYANGRALRPYRRLVIVRDDRFFYPSRGPLDATSSVGFFRRSTAARCSCAPATRPRRRRSAG